MKKIYTTLHALSLMAALLGYSVPAARADRPNPNPTIIAANPSASPELFRTLVGHEKAVNAVSIAANNRTVVSGSSDKTLKVWNLDSGELSDFQTVVTLGVNY